jgi:hypothetical protein
MSDVTISDYSVKGKFCGLIFYAAPEFGFGASEG